MQNVMPVRVIPARVHPGSCAGARLFVSYSLKFHQFYGTIRLAPQQIQLYVNTVQLFISPRNESRAIITQTPPYRQTKEEMKKEKISTQRLAKKLALSVRFFRQTLGTRLMNDPRVLIFV